MFSMGCCCADGLCHLTLRFVAIPVSLRYFVVCGYEAEAQAGFVGSFHYFPMFGRDDVFGSDSFGGTFFQREAGFYPSLADWTDKGWIMFLAEIVQQDASAFQAEGLVDDVPVRQVIEETGQEIAVMQDKLSGHFLPGGGVVVSVQQA